MSAQQLADASTQMLRQEQVKNIESEGYRESVQELLEQKRREAMAGQSESWRAGAHTNLTTNDATAPEVAALLSTDNHDDVNAITPILPISKSPRVGKIASNDDSEGHYSSSYDHNDNDNDNNDIHSVPSNDLDSSPVNKHRMDVEHQQHFSFEESKQQNNHDSAHNSHGHTSKRPLDIDAISRMTSGPPNPAKVRKLMEENMHNVDVFASSRDGESPRNNTTPKAQAPKVLELLKSSGGSLSHSGNNNHNVDDTPSPKAKLKLAVLIENPDIPLLNTSGGRDFKIVRPGGVTIDCTGLITDKRIQGLVKNSFTVEGRVKIPEVEKFVTEIRAKGKKIAASFILNVINTDVTGGSNLGYVKFCDEFATNQRAGLTNISKDVIVYTIPPQLKSHISFLDSIKLLNEDGVLYGIVITKEQGPLHLVNMDTSTIENTIAAQSSSISMIPTTPVEPISIINPIPSILPPPIPMMTMNTAELNSHNHIVSMNATSGLTAPLPPHPPPISLFEVPPALSVPPPPIPIAIKPLIPPTPILPVNPMLLNKPPQPPLPPPMFGGGVAPLPPRGITGVPAPPPPQMKVPGPPQLTTPKPPGPNPLLPQGNQDEMMRKVAQFCATKGPQTLQTLKDKPESKGLMPFLYDDHPMFSEFMRLLREFVALSNNQQG